MGNISLYVETDGQSDSPEQAIAEAAMGSNIVAYEEGDIVEVKIEATWTTPDGKHHARVSLVEHKKPAIDEKQLKQGAENEITTLNENNLEPALQEQEISKAPTDNLTDNDPFEDSSALELTPSMEDAEEELNHDFDESRDPNSRRSQDLKDEPAPEEGYHSEGLRRDNTPSANGKKKKPSPEETPA